MATDPTHLHGSCACQRNQYTVLIPNTTSTSRAQVFFDNSALSRRAQASPVTAWLRVPLAWYTSQTHAHFPDETPSTIKRTFHTPPSQRQFCGFCGSHLTHWNERPANTEEEYMDVTLGSLSSSSLEKLQALSLLPHLEEETEDEGLAMGGSVNEETHIPTQGSSTGEVVRAPPHLMSNRGMVYFEEMVENSRLGRIKRQVGGHRSQDGTMQWEIIEMGGSADEVNTPASGNKRPRLDI